MISLEGKVSIITGAASGIGLATSKLFLELGSAVYGVDIGPAPEELQLNEKFKFQKIDLRRPEAPEQVVKGCQASFGERVDVLLNIAGVMDTNNSVDSLDEAAWDRIIAINLTVPTLLSKHVVNVFLKQGGGSIVNISSKAGLSGAVAGVAYTASKHGVIGLTKNVAWRFHNENIRCNAICPGGFVSNITKSIDMSKIDREAMKVIGPVQALHVGEMTATATADKVASLMAFLSSDAASEINGSIIPIDNAWSCI